MLKLEKRKEIHSVYSTKSGTLVVRLRESVNKRKSNFSFSFFSQEFDWRVKREIENSVLLREGPFAKS